MKKNDLLTQLRGKFAIVLKIEAVEPEIAGVRWYIANVLDTTGIMRPRAMWASM